MIRAALLLCFLAVLFGGGPAHAHAQLVAGEPAAGAVVAEPPAAATLVFSEPVRPLVFRWFPPDGAPPVDAVPRATGESVAVPLPPDPAMGTWLLSWRVVSADGHPVGGSFAFSIGRASGAADAETAAGNQATAAAVAHGLLTLAVVFGVGGVVFLRVVDRGPPGGLAPALARGSALAVPPLAVVALGLHGLDLLGLALGDLLTAAPWQAALASPFAASAVAASLAAVVAVVGTRAGAALLAWALAATSFALFGHAATAAPRWLTAPSVAIHARPSSSGSGRCPASPRARRGPDPRSCRRCAAFRRSRCRWSRSWC